MKKIDYKMGLLRSNLFSWVPDYYFVKLLYYLETGKKVNLKKPVTYNEKLQWLKLYNRKPEYAIWSDKYLVRSYISKVIGSEYLIQLLGIYNSVDEIIFNQLPEKFVLKVTNGSGTNIVCNSKNNFDITTSKRLLRKWMKRDGSRFGREWVYSVYKPKIIAEQFIGDENGKPPKDYKIMCFDGKAKLIQVHNDRYGEHTNDFYDMNWIKTDIMQGVPNSDTNEIKPKCFDEMISISETLSKNTKFCRIDLYVVDNRIYFGEITLFPTSGFSLFNKQQYDIQLGNWIKL